jgi:hypothetical protein
MFFISIFIVGITTVVCKDFYSFTVKDWQGNNVLLEQYRGKVDRCHTLYRIIYILLYSRFHWQST